MKDIIENNLNSIHTRINNACAQANRNPKDVQLLLATKTVNADRIKLALGCEESLIAENKVQELKEKYEDLKSTPHETHFIGHLQANIYSLADGIYIIQLSNETETKSVKLIKKG